MNDDNNALIVSLLREILELEDDERVERHHRLREDLGIDSLGSLELLSRLSEALAIDLDMEEAMDISTVADACGFVERNYVAQRGAAGGC